jgi:hypothetical protein
MSNSFEIVFKNAAHAFATFFKAAKADIIKYEPIVVADLTKVIATQTTVEAVTGAVGSVVAPAFVPLALTVEDAGFALLGEVVKALNAGGAAVEANLVNAGLDQNVLTAVKAVAASATQVVTLVKAATK